MKIFKWYVKITGHAFRVKKLSLVFQGSNNSGKYYMWNVFGTGVCIADYNFLKDEV